MAFQAHMSVKGTKQGQFKGEGTHDRRRDQWIPIVNFSMGVKSPRDLATGRASGKRQFDPVSIVKEWGAASPQGLTACATNEVLSEVRFEFTRINPDGEEYVYQTVTLTHASLLQVRRFTGFEGSTETAAGECPAGDKSSLEEWRFLFARIDVEDKDGKTSYADENLPQA